MVSGRLINHRRTRAQGVAGQVLPMFVLSYMCLKACNTCDCSWLCGEVFVPMVSMTTIWKRLKSGECSRISEARSSLWGGAKTSSCSQLPVLLWCLP